MDSLLHRVRGLRPWAWLAEKVAAPLYAVFWEYVLNFRGKLLYLRSNYRRRHDATLDRRGVKIVRSPEFVAFVERLRALIPPAALEDARAQLLATPEEYTTDVFDTLDHQARVEIAKFALSGAVLQLVIPYLRVVPRLRRPAMLFNIARPHLIEEGSKLWHRDAYSYRCLTLFMCLTDLDEGSGPYSAIGTDLIPIHADIPKRRIDQSLSVWRRYRLSNEEMSEYVDLAKTTKLLGPAGTAVMVDSGNCYHKGGYCTTADRLMLELRYVTDDGDFDLPGSATFVDMNDPQLAPLLSNPIVRYMTASAEATPVRRWKLWRLLKFVYRDGIRYYPQPRT